MESKMYTITLSESELNDIDEALKSKANTAMNMYNESQYTYWMSFARRLLFQRFMIKVKTARHEKKVKVKEPTQPIKMSIVVESKMNLDVPTFERNAFKTH